VPVPKVAMDVQDLTGGLNRRDAASMIRPNQARRLRNVDPSSRGAWMPRAGWEAWCTAFNQSGGTGAVRGGARIYLDGVTPFTLAAKIGTTRVSTIADIGGTASAHTVVPSPSIDSQAEVYFPHDAELVAVLDGVTVPLKSTTGANGSWTQLGITPPVAAPTLAAGGASGSLIDAHTYEVSSAYADEDGLGITSNESDTATIAIAAPNLNFTAEVAFSADPQVDQIYVYVRDVTAGEPIRRFAGQVANPGSGTAAVSVTTNNWSSAEAAPTLRTVAPALEFAFVFKNRWWGWDPDDPRVLRFTEVFEQQYWPVTYSIELPFTRGDKIRAGVVDGDTAIIFGLTSAFVVVAQTPVDFVVRPLRVMNGAFGPRAVAALETGGVAHAGPTGVGVLSGDSDRLISLGFENEWREMVGTASGAQLARLPLGYHARDKELRVAVPFLPPYGSAGEYVLSLERADAGDAPAWATTDRPIGGYIFWDGPESIAGNIGRSFGWSPTVDIITEESIGTSADGDDQITDYEGPEIVPFGPVVGRFLRYCMTFRPSDGTFGVDVKVDGITVCNIPVPIGSGLSLYGTALYGTATYGGASRQTVCFDLPVTAEGTAIQIKGQYEGQADFTWFGYRITGRPEPEERGV
jgi:hypothetical protein